MSSRPDPTPDAVRYQILDAALVRLRHYGYGKTTMAEIADDTGMSVGNLYRYFRSKEEIAMTCAQRCLQDRADALRSIPAKSEVPASALLLEYILSIMRFTHEMSSRNPHIFELLGLIAERHQEIVHEKNREEQRILAQILRHGNSTQEWNIQDIEQAAHAVHAALFLFQSPSAMPFFSVEQFESLALSVTHLLVQGLRNAHYPQETMQP